MSQAERSLEELINTDEPGMALVDGWAAGATRVVEVLPVDVAQAERTLLALQVTTRSPLGAIAYATGGILVEHGWMRILGAGSRKMPRNIADWNGLAKPHAERRLPGALLVGDDVLGGFFAVNGGGLGGPPGSVSYLAPDTYEWEDLELGHSDWVHWVLTGDVGRFYEGMRWGGWELEVAALRGDQCLSVYPFLWADGGPIAGRSRKPVPVAEIWNLHAHEFPRQLAEVAANLNDS